MIIILSNLIDNAIKFTCNDGEILVSAEKKKNRVAISVRDNGIGIEEKELDKIFDRFYKVNNKSSYEGSGLGLAIVREMSELIEAKIEVSSIPDHGSTFSIILKDKKDVTFLKKFRNLVNKMLP
jgi:signal transduction histidine kinase